jgi:hypothetical protein
MLTPDSTLHALNIVVGIFVLMGSPYFFRFFLKRCLDSEGTWMPILYFFIAMLSLAAYIDLGIIVYRFVLTRA